jgi:16S rRNA (cytosine967-C5)-methyltransferase
VERSARSLAAAVLGRIDDEGAYANIVLPAALAASALAERDRAFATELVYGTTRMRRACDFLVDRFLLRPVDARVRTALRLGAYQLHFLATPAHAAVGETVGLAPPRARGLVNAVLRRVATTGVVWPDLATRLSYPDWIVTRLTADLGEAAAVEALEYMNRAATVTERDDGYVQDAASQWVAAAVEAGPGHRVADLCAAPGGKATAMAATGAAVVALDVRPSRARLVAANAARLGPRLAVVTADGRHPPLRPGGWDRVLVDAPCSGLGALRRRPDARWRIEAADVERLATLQTELVDAAAALLAPDGTLVYSVCTLTAAVSLAVDDHVAATHPALAALPPLGPPWEPYGRGSRLLPQTADTDGMILFRYRSSPPQLSPTRTRGNDSA